MFSATFSKQIKSLAKGMITDPIMIEVAAANSTAETIKQMIHPVDKERKREVLIHLIKKNHWHQVLVFSRTKHGANRLASQLVEAGINAAAIHADRTQHARTRALDGFRKGDVVVLVATDIAARGIDVNQLPCVVNLDLPDVPEDYVHRIGRTGRAGTAGLAVSLVSDEESKKLQAIERVIGCKLEQEILPGFAPTEKAPVATSDDDEWGNFEPDPQPSRRGRSQGRGRRSGNSSKQKKSR